MRHLRNITKTQVFPYVLEDRDKISMKPKDQEVIISSMHIRYQTGADGERAQPEIQDQGARNPGFRQPAFIAPELVRIWVQ
jgi:hypothetical protein